jgi:uncharacterized membrane protein required for colicin V production
MDWSLIIFIFVLTFFAYRGYKKGLLKSLSRVLSLIAGYVVAILYAGYISKLVESNTPLQGIAAFVAASLMLFIGAGIAINLLFRIIGELMPEEHSESKGSSLGGAAVGLVVGLVVAVAVVWIFAFVRDMQPDHEVATPTPVPKSAIENFASTAASKVVSTAMNLGSAKPEVISLSTALIESPGEVTQQAQRLANSNDINALLRDPANQAVINSNDIEALQALPAFQQLAKNPDLLALTKSAGMVDDSDNTAAVEAELASQITDIWGRMQRMKNDTRVQEILSDPEFQQKIQSGNPIDMLSNAKLLELANIIFADEAGTTNAAGEANNTTNQVQADKASTKKPEKKGTLVYSWTDKNGKTHFSDQPTEQ